MMLHVAAAQMGPVALLEQAHRQAVEPVVLPEMALTTFFPGCLIEPGPRAGRLLRGRDALVERNQAGVNSIAYRPGPYSPALEAGVIKFVDWYCAKLARHLGGSRLAAVA